MCTAVSYKTKDHYFGRNLDLEYSYRETITITPRNYVFPFRKAEKLKNHFAMIGMAYVFEDYPQFPSPFLYLTISYLEEDSFTVPNGERIEYKLETKRLTMKFENLIRNNIGLADYEKYSKKMNDLIFKLSKYL